jgi:hypothetical protein
MRGVQALLLGALALVAGAERAAAQQALCVYQDRSYSDGAHICIQRQLMLTCSADGARVAWKIVDDRQLANLCTTPIAVTHWRTPEVRGAPPGRHTPAARRSSADARNARCFVFMGRRFCE